MAIHAVDKLMEQTRKLAAEYYQTTQQTLPISAELARYDAMRLLSLVEPAVATVGVDAVGSGQLQDKRIQIKGRVIFDESKSHYRIGQLKTEGQWELLLLVLFNANYEVMAIHGCSRDLISEALQDKNNPKRSKRGAMSVARFRAIGKLLWTQHEGEIGV
jgi:hypothetical protein